MKVRINPKKKRKPKVVKTPGAKSDSESEVEDQTPAQKETTSRLKLQKLKARRCPNMVKIKTKFGIATVRKPGMPFKKKNKPGLGERKKFKKSDLMTVTRNQDRKGLGKLIRPFASGDLLQPRMAFADRYLQRITRPPLRETTWIPGDTAAGTQGHMDVDPRRQDSYRLLRKLFKIMKMQDEYLNPEMRAFGKKRKKDIPLVDLTDDNFLDQKGKDIPQSEGESSADERCTHLAFLTPAPSFGDKSGDEENFD